MAKKVAKKRMANGLPASKQQIMRSCRIFLSGSNVCQPKEALARLNQHGDKDRYKFTLVDVQKCIEELRKDGKLFALTEFNNSGSNIIQFIIHTAVQTSTPLSDLTTGELEGEVENLLREHEEFINDNLEEGKDEVDLINDLDDYLRVNEDSSLDEEESLGNPDTSWSLSELQGIRDDIDRIESVEKTWRQEAWRELELLLPDFWAFKKYVDEKPAAKKAAKKGAKKG